ncbi:unnamed protein product [Effrenium voratum]|nr:unnamed protein product [Effrenium voratum]
MGSAASARLTEGVAGASVAELASSAKELSSEERSQLLAAIARLEVLGTYLASASNGDWGDYDIRLEIGEAKAEVNITRCDFRDSPAKQWEYEGAWSMSGDLLTFTPSDEKKAAEDEENKFPMRFKIQGDGALAKIKEDGTVDMIQGGYDGKPVLSVCQALVFSFHESKSQKACDHALTPFLQKSLANKMFDHCGASCIYDFEKPDNVTYSWDNAGCYKQDDACLGHVEQTGAIERKKKMCEDTSCIQMVPEMSDALMKRYCGQLRSSDCSNGGI